MIKMSKEVVVNTMNRRISQNIYMTIDTKVTDLNNNIFLIGGSGAGKSYRFAKPNLLQMVGSYIVTDPKGEMLRDTAGVMKKYGYKVKAINLLNGKEMRKSIHYNPFRYLKEDTDVITLIKQMMDNTTPKGASASDPFWEKAETMLWLALFFYTWKEGVVMPDGTVDRNFPAVMELLKKAEFKTDSRGNKLDSELDKLMRVLERENPNHPAVINYNKSMRGAADTVRTIIISANARLAVLENEILLDVLNEDEIHIESFGREKTILYCVIPDNDKSFNFIVGMLYSQIFKELYYQADFVYDGSLPVHVTCMFDEFANVALPDDFTSLLTTMRSRNISSVIIVQNMTQIKKLFKDDWETISGNCDTLIYLGGNEQSTHKYISESLGKMTIDKKSSSESKGKSGSVSNSMDVLGRELLMADEVRKLSRRKCVVFIRGFDPVIDDKINTSRHPLWKELCQEKKKYRYDARLDRVKPNRMLINAATIQHIVALDDIMQKDYDYEKMVAERTKGEMPEEFKRKVLQIDIADLMALDLDHMDYEDMLHLEDNLEEIKKNRIVTEEREKQLKEKIEQEEKKKIHINELNQDETIAMLALKQRGFSEKQIKIILNLVKTNKKWELLLDFFEPEFTEEELLAYVKKLSE